MNPNIKQQSITSPANVNAETADLIRDFLVVVSADKLR